MYKSLFKFGVFNAVQSQCYDTVMNTNENMVTPTGSGKTVLFELAIIQLLQQRSDAHEKKRCVYIAPTKSLCSEKSSSWETKFTPFGAKCSELTGDTVNTGRGAWGDAKDATIMLDPSCAARPLTLIPLSGEKWDSLTRNWQDHCHILSQIQLFLIDEVHLLNESRGSTLEVVVSRMKLRGSAVRFLVVSATVPNVVDVADWIGNRAGDGPAIVKEFGDEFRPCKLTKFVYGVPRRRDTNDFVYAKALDYKLYGILQQHCNNKPVLVFCPTRKGAMAAAEQILKDYEEATSKKETLPWSRPPRIGHSFGNKQLDKLAACGISVHHAGLSREDRSATERLYLDRSIKVLFATSTLAVGVNLPAHTVVIKGVKLFMNNTSQEYSDLDVMQMMGRAGRPQFDKEGVAIIMCEQELEAKYRALAQGQTVLESSLHMQLAEHLNSEIALGTIRDMNTAKEWLHSSFLFRRLQKNSAHYDIRKERAKSWEERMEDLVADSVKTLTQAEMVKRDDDDGLCSTEYGDIMSKFYIRQATMALILKLSGKATIREIVYNKLRTHNDIRYTIKKIEKPSDKVFILIQAILSAINLSDPEYKTGETQPYMESLPIMRHVSRIARAIVEVANMRRDGLLIKNALEVMRCLNAKAWEDRSVVLAEHNVTTFAALRRMDPCLIESILNRKPPFGHDLIASVNQLPQYMLTIAELDVSPQEDGVDVELSIECGLTRDPKSAKSKKLKKQKRWDMTIVLTLTSDNDFVDFRRISTSALKENRTFEVAAKLTKPSQGITVYMTSARDLAGLEDMPDFWDMDVDEDNEQVVAKREPIAPEMGMGRCNHTCKDKAQCRHLCCRDGLVKPPPMTKKMIEMLVAADDDTRASQSKPKPRPREAPKPKPKVDRSLKQLEALHERTGVEKNLLLGDDGRIKLDQELDVRRRKPVPNFDIELTRMDDTPAGTARRASVALSDSGDELPEPGRVLEALKGYGSKTKTVSSDSADYADPEFDALIAALPLSDGGGRLVRRSDDSGLDVDSHFSPATSPAPPLIDDEDGFTVDTSLLDITPATPPLTETSVAHGQFSGIALARQPAFGFAKTVDEPGAGRTDNPDIPVDDPLAELEAWLQSDAVETGGE
ncbi:P-loop containing nucleoside triphosphate hydrolase protein [Trametes elegans]|nr:P-loop containing nucleoside triphosphate hydrolase protein [Trametes elegans]